MARIKRTLIIKREGAVVKETPVEPRTPRHPKVRVRPLNEWGMTKTEQRLATPMPRRVDLTKAQWQEWGDALKELRTYDYSGAEFLSLNEMRQVLESIRRCTDMRLFAQQSI